MKNRIGVLVVVAAIIVPGIVAKAQTGGANSVTLSSAVPSSGQVQVSGTYTVASGYTFSSITVEVQPSGGVGGEGAEGVATTDGMGDFSATLQVPGGVTYDVQVYMTVTDSTGTPYYFYSNAITGLPVPN
jgi:hypothetical protein